jgi:hypothetical protein
MSHIAAIINTFEGHMVGDDESEHDTWNFEMERL